MAHVSKVVITQSQNVTIEHSVQQLVITNGLPNWLYIRVGGSDLPNANTADLSVAPLSMGAFPIVPTRNFGITVGDVTILATTNVPITQAVCMFYEVPEPVTLGQVPLSPGGFRYRQILNNNAVLSNGATWSVDLSNFSNFRYSAYSRTAGAWWRIVIVRVLPAAQIALATTFVITTATVAACVSGIAGSILSMVLLAQDVNGNAVSLTLYDTLEAW